jgi:oligoribonuclease
MSHTLVWIDLEMTGLDSNKDVILEIATLVTNNDLVPLATGPQVVIHQPDDVLAAMSDWCKTHHTASGLMDAVQKSTLTVQQAEEHTLAFLKQHCAPKTALLCGNSVWQDRAFLVRFMPRIVDFLHYRMIDVTAVKELVTRWYPNNERTRFLKRETHRAYADIEESIAELQHYRTFFFMPR